MALTTNNLAYGKPIKGIKISIKVTRYPWNKKNEDGTQN